MLKIINLTNIEDVAVTNDWEVHVAFEEKEKLIFELVERGKDPMKCEHVIFELKRKAEKDWFEMYQLLDTESGHRMYIPKKDIETKELFLESLAELLDACGKTK